MMKKIMTFLLVAILSFSLGLTSLATDNVVTFSEDFLKLYCNGYVYSRVDASKIEYNYDNVVAEIEGYTDADGVVIYNDKMQYNIYEHMLSDTQSEIVESVELSSNSQGTIIDAIIYYYDGASLSVTYLRDDYIEEYKKVTQGKCENYLVDFFYPEGNTINLDREVLTEGPKTEVTNDMSFTVYAAASDNSFRASVGEIISHNDRYYFLDYSEIGAESESDFYENYNIDSLPVYEITDETAVAMLTSAEENFYDDDFGFLYDDELSTGISKVFFTIVFGGIPAAATIVSLIFAIKSKKLYKKLCFATSALATCSLGIFIAIVSIIF